MEDIATLVSRLSRPRLMVRAARIGAQDYSRNRHLHRLLSLSPLPGPAQAVLRLMELEAVLDGHRRAGDAGYQLARHLDVLIALVGEARLLQGPRSI
jgi:hypothetical protein